MSHLTSKSSRLNVKKILPNTVMTVLCIGDPHFKGDNKQETDMMELQVRDLIVKLDPTFVVVLGDILHTHEKIDLRANKRATSFLRTLRSVSKHLYVLIGNHDRPDNNVFLTDDHVFNSLKDWDKTTCVDNVEIKNHIGSDGRTYTFVFAPYVPPQRLDEALKTKGLISPYTDISGFFVHQEFKGAKMNAITSNEGDIWDAESPLCISGHIHDFDYLQDNLIYTGTPIQHTYADRSDKSISLITYGAPFSDILGLESKRSILRASVIKHERITLDIPMKIQLKMSPQDLMTYVMHPRAKIKIKVVGEATIINDVMKTSHVMALIAAGVKITIEDITPAASKMADINEKYLNVKIKIPFQSRLINAITTITDPGLQNTFYHLFPSMKI